MSLDEMQADRDRLFWALLELMWAPDGDLGLREQAWDRAKAALANSGAVCQVSDQHATDLRQWAESLARDMSAADD